MERKALLALLLAMFLCSPVLAWGPFTHSYIANEVNSAAKQAFARACPTATFSDAYFSAGALGPDLGWAVSSSTGTKFHSTSYLQSLYTASKQCSKPYLLSFALGWMAHVYGDKYFEDMSRNDFGVNLNTGGPPSSLGCLRLDIDTLSYRQYVTQLPAVYSYLRDLEVKNLLQNTYGLTFDNIFSVTTYVTMLGSITASCKNNRATTSAIWATKLSYYGNKTGCEDWKSSSLKKDTTVLLLLNSYIPSIRSKIKTNFSALR